MVLRFCSKDGKTPGKLLFTKLNQETIEIPTFLANQKQRIQMLQSEEKKE